MVAVNCVFDPPIRLSSFGVPVVPGGPPRIWTFVPTLEGGEPKLVPTIVTTDPQEPLDEAVEMLGSGTTVLVGVAVGPGVFVACGVIVGVSVAPSGAKALKPDV